jgi:hypothetical protein
VHGHFYSVPYRLMREVIEARITDQTIELFHKCCATIWMRICGDQDEKP